MTQYVVEMRIQFEVEAETDELLEFERDLREQADSMGWPRPKFITAERWRYEAQFVKPLPFTKRTLSGIRRGKDSSRTREKEDRLARGQS